MTRAKRILVLAGVVVLCVDGASASWFRNKANTKAPEATAPMTAMTLNAIEIEPAPALRLLLRTSGTPVYTSYSPAPSRFVVDLTATAKSPAVSIPSPLPPSVSAITVDEVTEMGTRLTRVVLTLAQPATLQASANDNTLAISLPAPSVAEARPAEEPLPAVVPVLPAPEPEPVKTVSEPVVVSEPISAEPSKSEAAPVMTASASTKALGKATALKSVTTSGSGSALEVNLAGDGELAYKAFKLENPTRVVVDLTGVHNKVAKNSIATSDALVKRIRVSQFTPDVTRVVVDLGDHANYDVVADGNRLRVRFGGAPATVAAVLPAETPAPAPAVVETAPAPAPVEIAPAPAPVKLAEAPATSAPKLEIRSNKSEMTVSAPAAKPADITAQVPTVAENAPEWKMPAQSPAKSPVRSVISAPAPQTAPPSTNRSTVRKSTTRATVTPSANDAVQQPPENVFNDPNPPGPVLGSTPAPAGTTSRLSGAGRTAGGRKLSTNEKIYTGEPIDLDLKDTDIKDVLRTFSTLTGLNIAVDPQVTGTVTVDFTAVPWDQALEVILHQNGLTYVLDGNVMRIGTVQRLSDEQRAQTALQEQEKLNVPLTTVSRKLSYAKAQEVSALLREMASPRARIIVDQRTNQLIISEIPTYLETMQALIDSVDVATRQVVIEARIVETSKTFLQQYGFTWGFGGTLDPSLGTGTGLVFPNRGNITGGPFEFGPGQPIISTHLANVLGTFTLDLALNAAESEGLIKVISAPRVMTQDNVAAEIQSGFQIPYQTRINFTTTISYLDATLRLSVTPQITESGTVIMDIAVQKTEPATGLAIEGGAGTPLSTRQAHTRLMVRDGGTAVIAGIYQTKDNSGQTRVPFVHNIPVLGALFRTHNVTSSHDELLIFITPRIVRNT
jgi:type IV pilus assembly protein PilQ